MSVEAVKFDRHQANIHGAGKSQFPGQPVHGSTNPPSSGATGEHDQSHTADDGSLFDQSGIPDQHRAVVGGVIVPRNLHVVFFHDIHKGV